MNLCTNAYHAMRDTGGVLEVSLSDVELASDFYCPTTWKSIQGLT